VTTVVVGGGPAALGLLSSALLGGSLDALLDDGLAILDASPAGRFGQGRLGRYQVRSDTRARVFAECAGPLLDGTGAPGDLLGRCRSDQPVPLPVAAALLAEAGRNVLGHLRARPGGTVRSRTRVCGVSAGPDGVWLRGAGWRPVRASRVVFAVGGRPWIPPDLPAGGRLLLHSDQVLRDGGYRTLLAWLAGRVRRVTVVGGSHSAFAVVGRLLRAPVRWAPGAITVAHRSPILVTYPDTGAARVDGVDPRPEQICPLTGVVHRFGGLRSDAAAVYRSVRGGSEPRVRLLRVPPGWDWLDVAARDDPVIVAATGYSSAAAGLLGEGRWDAAGRFRTPSGAVLPHVYGLGLGTARPRGPGTGGEPAFGGAIDGVWFYQNVVAPQVLPLVLADAAAG
jgi:hypothetical protein